MSTTGSLEGPDDPLTPFELKIAAGRPNSTNLDRDRLLFEAGRASAISSGGRRLQVWRASAFAMLLMTGGLAGLLASERSRSNELALTLARLEVPESAVGDSDRPLDPESSDSSARFASGAESDREPEPIAPDSLLAMTRRILEPERFDRPDPPPTAEPRPINPAPATRPATLRVRDWAKLSAPTSA